MTVSYLTVYYGRSFLFNHGFQQTAKVYVNARNIIIAIESILVGSVASSVAANLLMKPIDEAITVLRALGERDFSVKMHRRKKGKLFKKLSEAINTTVDELSSVELLRTDFVNNFSHEFKTPIVSIEGFAKLIKEGNLSKEEQDEYLDIIISESERLTKMSSDMLLLSFVERSGSAGNMTRCNLSEQIRETIADAYAKCAAAKKNVSIEFEGGEVYAECSAELMRHVWTNLIDNAVKYSGDSPEILITAEEKDGFAVVKVKDNGRGISAEELPNVFDKFYRSPSSDCAGSGVGLAIVKKITDLHSGRTEAESAEGKGSTFTVEIPVSET